MKKLSKMQQRVNAAFHPTSPRVRFGEFTGSKTIRVATVNPIKLPTPVSGWIVTPELKGKKDANCNRTACQKPRAFWLNSGTDKYYCLECAIDIGCFALSTRQDPMELFPTFDEDMLRYEAWLETQEQKTDMPFDHRNAGPKGQIRWAKRSRADALEAFARNTGQPA